MTDPFEFDDAAYVLGSLSADERTAFEQHLVTCAACRARVAEIGQLPDLLALVSADEAADATTADAPDLPETLLPALLRRAKTQRRRWVGAVTALGTLAAACAVALVVVLWPSSSNHPPAQQMTALAAVPITATVELQPTAWGTEIHLKCHYSAGAPAGYVYGLTVVDRSGHSYDLGTWSLAPGGSTDFTGGTSVPRASIATVQVTSAGQPVLQAAT